MFHVASFAESLGNVTNSDLNFAADEVLVSRNSHLYLTADYDLIAAYPNGANLTRMRFATIDMTRLAVPHLFPMRHAATVESRPGVVDFSEFPVALPKFVEVTLEASTDAVGPQDIKCPIWLQPRGMRQPVPPGPILPGVRFTGTSVAGTETTWTNLFDLTPERDLHAGSYGVIGGAVIASAANAFRLRFPTHPTYDGKQHRPGGLCSEADGDIPWEMQRMGKLGLWGTFDTDEVLQAQLFGDAAGAAREVRLDLVYLGPRR